jgi:hypothetical protein
MVTWERQSPRQHFKYNRTRPNTEEEGEEEDEADNDYYEEEQEQTC